MIMITVLNQLADCYMKVSDYALAEQTLEHVLALQGPNSSPEHEFITHQALADLYEQKGDHASATKHYKLAIASHRRLFSEANQRVLRETEKRAEVESALREKDLMKAHAEEMSKSRDALKALNERQIEILRIVSHDMRNPLGAIVGMAGELSRDDSVSLADARVIAHVIEGSAQKLVALTDELLLAAQLETGALRPKHSPVSIDELVLRSIDLIRPQAANKGIQLTTRARADQHTIAALDIEIVSHVLNNLLSNAVKFTAAGGNVAVDVGTDAENCTIRVTDTGIGIPETLMPSLFDPFNPARRPGTENEKGTGLGLPLVKQLIDLEGGSIKVASGSPRGTTVTVTLPLKTD
jgi:signal transduction histidine kinase